jgi:SAM-dependent methyltransferase
VKRALDDVAVRSKYDPETGGESPLEQTPPVVLFGALDDESWRWLNLVGRDACTFLHGYLPSLPDEAAQARTTATTGMEALAHGFETYALFRALYETYAGPLEPENSVLDFGCGWGRVTRFFLRDVKPENLVGIDIDEPALVAARETNRWCRFARCGVLPPTDLDDASLDLVYAWSVFSHLSEEAHLQWLEEFRRILRPGGVLLLSTLPRKFIERSGAWAAEDAALARWQRETAGLFAPEDRTLAAYDRGDFVYRPFDAAHNPHFGNACIPERYVRTEWRKYFVVREFRQGPLPQAVVACQKRPPRRRRPAASSSQAGGCV